MWNNGQPDPEREGAGEGGDEEAKVDPAVTTQTSQYAMAHGHGHLAGAPNYGQYDAYHGFSQTSVPLYSAQRSIEPMHHSLMSLQEQRHVLQQQQELQRMEYTRQQLQLVRQQEEVRIAQIAERRLQEEIAEQRRQHDDIAAHHLQREEEAGSDEEDNAAMQVDEPAPVVPRARGKPEALAMGLANKIREEEEKEDSKLPAIESAPPTQPTPKKKKKRKPSASPRKRTPAGSGPSMDDPVPSITEAEYRNVDALMKKFCRVPLLAEFSRPVALLHPELMSMYSKIVAHPIDLGYVCRNIRRRKYKDTRAIRLDMWRIFMNCAIYHTHPSNKDAVPSFVSIALHLREYFNALWEEYMIASDPVPSPEGKTLRGSSLAALHAAYENREENRKKRLSATSATLVSTRSLTKAVAAIERFVSNGGLVDDLDTQSILGENIAEDEGGNLIVVADNLRQLEKRLDQIGHSEQEYNVEDFVHDVRQCYAAEDLFENKLSLRVRIGHRINRLLGQIIVPIYESGCRGVNQSSVWGCMAAAIWARESSKKPYWPALVLGIIAPDDQKEDWHEVLTERNEQRLPPKIRTELQAGKRKAAQALRRQKTAGTEQMSYFLVEFMGTHEFIWVRESDIIESFDPDEDPNLAAAAGNITKKKRSSRSHDVASSKTFALALEEGRWALDEFEMQLNDTCGDLMEEEEEDEQEDGEQEMNYSYAVLSQSDEEADEADSELEYNTLGERVLSASEVEEANELLLTDGLLDFTMEGRKNAKKRALALKKQKASEEKAAQKKEKSKSKSSQKSKSAQKKSKGSNNRDTKREQRELERTRKKRSREREKFLREESRNAKKRRVSVGTVDVEVPNSEAIYSRRGRANAIVRGYLMRLTKSDDSKNLSVGNMMTIPSSALDSTGLLGMALAFRAAAGQVDFHASGDQPPKSTPWDALDVDGPRTSEERTKNLEKQVELLEAEIRRLKEATIERKRLASAAFAKREASEQAILSHEDAARQVINQRAKKKTKTPPKSKTGQDEGLSGDVNIEADELIVEVAVDEEIFPAVEQIGDRKATDSLTPDDAGYSQELREE